VDAPHAGFGARPSQRQSRSRFECRDPLPICLADEVQKQEIGVDQQPVGPVLLDEFVDPTHVAPFNCLIFMPQAKW